MNVFFKSENSYYPLSWMFHSRKRPISLSHKMSQLNCSANQLTGFYMRGTLVVKGLNNKINRLHERCLRFMYNENTSSFTERLVKDNSVYMHHRNI